MASMLQFEEHLQDELNSVGRLTADQQLQHLDTNGEPIVRGAIRLTSKKKKEPKVYETPWRALRIERYGHQSCRGGKTFCPLDHSGAAAPEYGKQIFIRRFTGETRL